MTLTARRISRRAFTGWSLMVILCGLLFTACSAQRAPSTPTALPSTPLSVLPTVIVASPSPTSTSAALAALIPTGIPARSWEGIPIMPEARAGDGDDLGYTFIIQAGADQIVDYYRREMADLGWEYSVSGSNAVNGSLMIFLKGQETLTISYFPYGDEMLVLIVK